MATQARQPKTTEFDMVKFLDRIGENFATAFKKGQFDCFSEFKTDMAGASNIVENAQDLTDVVVGSICKKMNITLAQLYKLQPQHYGWQLKNLDDGDLFQVTFKIIDSTTRKEEKKNGAALVYTCGNCKKIGEGFKKCGGCKKSIYYCSRECQKNDWKYHKTDCKN